MRVITVNSKGAFEVPPEKLSSLDLPFNISAVRGANKIEIDPASLSPLAVQIECAVDVASIYRIPLENDTFLDILSVYPDEMILIGIGKLDEKRGENEPVYIENLAGKPLSEFVISEGIPLKTLIAEVKESICDDPEAAEDFAGTVGDEVYNKIVKAVNVLENEKDEKAVNLLFEGVREAAQKLGGREFRSYFPETASFIREKKDGKIIYNVEKIRPQENLTKDKVTQMFVEGKAQKLTLNGVLVGVTQDNDVAVVFSPERIKMMSSLAAAKTLTNRSISFKAFNYVSNLSMKRFNTPEKREKIAAKLEKYLSDMKEKGETIGVDTLSKLIEAVRENDEKMIEAFLIKAHDVKNGIIRDFFKKERLYNPAELLKEKAGSGFFLRNYMSNYGIPLEDFSKFSAMIFTVMPRPIKIEGKWQIQKGLKPIGGIIEENGKKTTYAFEKSDAYTMSFDYPIFKVLKAVAVDTDKYSWKQIRALFGDGFENFKGLGQIEKDLSAFKNASAVYTDFIKYIRDVVADVIYKEDTELDEEEAKRLVSEKILTDSVLNDYITSMTEFLAGRNSKIYSLTKITEKPSDFVKHLLQDGIVYKDKATKTYKINWKNLEKKADEIEPFLKEDCPHSVKFAVRAVVNTLNAVALTSFKPDKLAERDAKILAEQIRNSLEFIIDVEEIKAKKYTSVAIESFKSKEETTKETGAEKSKAEAVKTKVEEKPQKTLDEVKSEISQKADSIVVDLDLIEEETLEAAAVEYIEDDDLESILDEAKDGLESGIDLDF